MRVDDWQRERLAAADAVVTAPAPLGAVVLAGGTRFAVRAPLADSVSLCLFDADGSERRLRMRCEGDDHVVEAPGVGAGQRYGYRAMGPWAPERGLFFDPAKLLVDPYAVELDRRFAWDARLAAFGEDTAALVPKAIVPGAEPTADPLAPVFAPGGLIYELNVRGFTLRHPDVPAEQRGTIAALAHPAVIAHLQKLHVSAIELLPITAWIDERHLAALGLRNYWGYNPVAPMALDLGLAPGGVAELRDTVAKLRAAGIGVILDLVFNHTGEGDRLGPTLALRGLDPAAYATENGALVNHAGTGNMLDARQPAVRRLILDSLRHFAGMGVDGFRFDLAPVIARMPDFDPHAPIFAEIAADPLLADRVMIAEPWDIGPNGYQLGHFPANWLEWNDRYRDDVRRFWRGDPDMAGWLATRMAGSSDLFQVTSRSVSYVACHDGFALADVVAYNRKHNEANGENNRDGADEVSWNNGAEGPDGPEVAARRAADARVLLATLFATKGTIMLAAGDEFGRTQAGNNNAYCQDNAIGWLDWDGRDRELEAFTAALAEGRAAHPEIGAPAFLTVADWLTLGGEPMTAERWAGAAGYEVRYGDVAIRIDRRARTATLSGRPR